MADSLNENSLKTKLPKRILQCFVSNDGDGVTESIFNNYQYMDRKVIKYDFLYIKEKPWFSKELENQGSQFIKIPSLKNPIAYFNSIRRVICNEKYDAVYFNLSFGHIFPVLAAYMGHAAKIIVHAHASDIDRDASWKRFIIRCYHKISRNLWGRLIDYHLACSEVAGQFLFKKDDLDKLYLVHNSIDLKKYYFNDEIRMQVRRELGISPSTFVVGHVGRFSYQKNHDYLIHVFDEINKINSNSILLLVGDGPEKQKIQDKVQELGLTKKVLFLGYRKDVNKLMMAMDVFILPSRSEGLAIVLIEAQASGLQCLVSKMVSKEAIASPLIKFLDISINPRHWAECALKDAKILNRASPYDCIKEHGYDNRTEALKIQDFYLREL